MFGGFGSCSSDRRGLSAGGERSERVEPSGVVDLEDIDSARQALALEDQLEDQAREQLRAAGVFERFAVDALGSAVSLFEVFAREQFSKRVHDADAATRGKGNVFQRLDDTAALFAEHASLDVVSLARADRWDRLKRAFTQRHMLTHRDGIVDQRFLDQVRDSCLAVGQRLVIRRPDAEVALGDLEALVRAFSKSRATTDSNHRRRSA